MKQPVGAILSCVWLFMDSEVVSIRLYGHNSCQTFERTAPIMNAIGARSGFELEKSLFNVTILPSCYFVIFKVQRESLMNLLPLYLRALISNNILMEARVLLEGRGRYISLAVQWILLKNRYQPVTMSTKLMIFVLAGSQGLLKSSLSGAKAWSETCLTQSLTTLQLGCTFKHSMTLLCELVIKKRLRLHNLLWIKKCQLHQHSGRTCDDDTDKYNAQDKNQLQNYS